VETPLCSLVTLRGGRRQYLDDEIWWTGDKVRANDLLSLPSDKQEVWLDDRNWRQNHVHRRGDQGSEMVCFDVLPETDRKSHQQPLVQRTRRRGHLNVPFQKFIAIPIL